MRWVVSLLVAWAGCARPCEGAADPRACFSEHYFQGYAESKTPSCAEGPLPQIGGQLRVDPHLGGQSGDEHVVAQGHRLQRFYAPYGLSLYTDHLAKGAGLNYGLAGTMNQIINAALGAGVPLDRPLTADEEQRLRRSVGQVVFGELRRFIESHPLEEGVNLVVLQQMVSPDFAALPLGGSTLLGLGLSPALLSHLREEDPNDDLYPLIGLPEKFTPVLLVAHRDVERLVANGDIVVAHELGHALGLAHTSSSENVLSHGSVRETCNPTLSEAQVAAVEGVERAALAVEPVEGWRSALQVIDALVAEVRRNHE